ncbi:hypothetical protein FY528_09015 [Hymenobacter lutimineralis]|uniref:Uncharacterized protein n=1 Tax=Hymenobacter lutimineralis TaxID=2606448 RepID=A0A5D6V614_9BACT|nr:hypothetical protein [Hymenobacter lutimineralis]TYZ10592.1 hypothetical protein FY528_09015 [Hymenobacter lutimineralis]
MPSLLPQPAYAVRPFYWPTIQAGQWLILKVRGSQVPYVVCVVENYLGCAGRPYLIVHMGQPSRPITLQGTDIQVLKHYSGLLPVRCSH